MITQPSLFIHRHDVRSFFAIIIKNLSPTYLYSVRTEESGAWQNYWEAPAIHPKGIWEFLKAHKPFSLSSSAGITITVSTSAQENKDFLETNYQY